MESFPALRRYEEELSGFRSEKRRAERLAARALLLQVLGENFTIVYTPEGRPCLATASGSEPTPWHLSISDTGPFVAMSLAPFAHGMDVEAYDPRALRLARRFLSDDELREFAPDARMATLLWSAKEAVFKRVEEQSDLTISQIRLHRRTDLLLDATWPSATQPVCVAGCYMPRFVLTFAK